MSPIVNISLGIPNFKQLTDAASFDKKNACQRSTSLFLFLHKLYFFSLILRLSKGLCPKIAGTWSLIINPELSYDAAVII